MRIVALIMAGGKGSRFGKDVEKPMIKLLGKPLIRRVIEAAKASKSISATYVAVRFFNSQTAKEATKSSANIIETEGLGYHADLQQAVFKHNLYCPVVNISSDLPLLTGEFLDEIIAAYQKVRKPALTVLVPTEECHKYGITPTSFYEHQGEKYAISGINIVDGQRIFEEQLQEIVICKKPEAIFNVNSPQDLELAKKYLTKIKRLENGSTLSI